ncbi:MAG: N-acetylmuramoyl-L-alanine amidase [Bacteroidales bacterium]
MIRRVVIDPGHGGGDPGAISPDRKIKEKNITLSVSLKLGELIKKRYPQIEVIYTRKTDVFIPLDKRTEIANRNKADLFISIHVNSVEARSASGSETFVMGVDKTSSNLQVTMLENSVVLMEGDDYATRYEGFDPKNPESYIIFSLLQNAHLEQSLEMASLIQKHFSNGPVKVNRGIKQAPLLVLWKTSMPSVLVELGFISNPLDMKALINPANHDKFASLIFNAFIEYKLHYEKDYKANNKEKDSIPKAVKDTTLKETILKDPPLVAKDPVTTIKESLNKDTVSKSKVVTEINTTPAIKNTLYSVQIMAVGKVLPPDSPEFKGRRGVTPYRVGKLYKYTIGEYKTPDEAAQAQKLLSKDFPGAFIVGIKDGTIFPVNR